MASQLENNFVGACYMCNKLLSNEQKSENLNSLVCKNCAMSNLQNKTNFIEKLFKKCLFSLENAKCQNDVDQTDIDNSKLKMVDLILFNLHLFNQICQLQHQFTQLKCFQDSTASKENAKDLKSDSTKNSEFNLISSDFDTFRNLKGQSSMRQLVLNKSNVLSLEQTQHQIEQKHANSLPLTNSKTIQTSKEQEHSEIRITKVKNNLRGSNPLDRQEQKAQYPESTEIHQEIQACFDNPFVSLGKEKLTNKSRISLKGSQQSLMIRDQAQPNNQEDQKINTIVHNNSKRLIQRVEKEFIVGKNCMQNKRSFVLEQIQRNKNSENAIKSIIHQQQQQPQQSNLSIQLSNDSMLTSNLENFQFSEASVSARNSSLCNIENYISQFPTPQQERLIIKNIMLQEFGEQDHKMLHIGNKGFYGQPKYIISASWWREWLSYVNFSQSADNNISQCMDNNLTRKRPNKMINKELLKQDAIYNFKSSKNAELKDNLLEHYEYEAVSQNTFNYLKKWYDIDVEIVRFLKYDPSQEIGQCLYLDLYPEKILQKALPIGLKQNLRRPCKTSRYYKSLQNSFQVNSARLSKDQNNQNNNNTSENYNLESLDSKEITFEISDDKVKLEGQEPQNKFCNIFKLGNLFKF